MEHSAPSWYSLSLLLGILRQLRPAWGGHGVQPGAAAIGAWPLPRDPGGSGLEGPGLPGRRLAGRWLVDSVAACRYWSRPYPARLGWGVSGLPPRVRALTEARRPARSPAAVPGARPAPRRRRSPSPPPARRLPPRCAGRARR